MTHQVPAGIPPRGDEEAGPSSASLGNFLDNGPPVYVHDAVDQLKKRLARFEARRDEFAAKIGKVVKIRDRQDVGSAADIIGLAEDVAKMVDAERKAIADPHSDTVVALSGYRAKFWEPVQLEIDRLRKLVTEFARDERRKAAEQVEEQRQVEEGLRRQREALAGKSASPTVRDESDAFPPTGVPIPAKARSYRGDYGRQAIVLDDYEIEIVDPRQLPDYIFATDKVKEAIIAVARTFRKTGIDQIPGLNITTGVKTQIRR